VQLDAAGPLGRGDGVELDGGGAGEDADLGGAEGQGRAVDIWGMSPVKIRVSRALGVERLVCVRLRSLRGDPECVDVVLGEGSDGAGDAF
jgi:hypothetical protein